MESKLSNAYIEEINQWRRERDASIRRENNWLALAGLCWLEPGENLVGSGDDVEVYLPARLNIPVIGKITLTDQTATFDVNDDVDLLIDGEPLKKTALIPDISGSPTVMTIDRVKMVLVQRGERFGIRVWDNARPERETHPPREWFSIEESFRVAAKYTPYEPPKKVTILNAVGIPSEEEMDGFVIFSFGGQECQLDVFQLEDGSLYALFKDASSGSETYPTGRYLVSEIVAGNDVLIDFNKTYNPPCAFTPYATCPVPPNNNHLSVAVQAGEKYSGEH
jgi:uncharacterized protein (DUF1684 family)